MEVLNESDATVQGTGAQDQDASVQDVGISSLISSNAKGEKTHLNPFWNVSVFDEVDSTNTRIKTLVAEGAAEGTCICARRQSGAYGRQGRSWASPAGGLYFSFILDPLHAHQRSSTAQLGAPALKEEMRNTNESTPRSEPTLKSVPTLSLILSLAIQDVLTSFTQRDDIFIKWPNDVVLKKGSTIEKLVGISLELVNQKLCCGIGINVFHPSKEQSEGDPHTFDRYAPAYLEDLAPQLQETPQNKQDKQEVLNELLASSLNQIHTLYLQWLDVGIAPFIPRYDQLLYNIGQQVELDSIQGNLLYAGEVMGVSHEGELILKNDSGELIRANSGEVHTRL